MKKKIFFGMLIILLFLFVISNLAEASLFSFPNIQVTLVSQTPDPVEPGQVVEVKFKIENTGRETTENTFVKIIPEYPFSLYGDQPEQNIGKLKSFSGADAEVVKFKLKVDENAIEGNQEIKLEVQVGNNLRNQTIIKKFNIDIQTNDAVLDIVSIESNPDQIAPGETAKVSIMVKNLADSLLKDIKFKLDFDDENLPLAPYQTSSERRISLLAPNYQNSLEFNIIADPESTPGLYKLPLTITYNDEKGNSYSVNDILAVIIGETPKLNAYIKKSTVLQSNKEGKITLEIANSGSSDLKFLEMQLLPSDDYTLITTTNYFYLGDVDSDDTESEEVDIFIPRGKKTVSIPIKLKYTDANNKPFQQQFDLELQLYSKSKLKKFGVIGSSKVWVYFFLILLAIGGYLYYRYDKNKKNNNKKR